MRIAVVIVNYRTPELVRECLLSLVNERSDNKNMTVTVVDGGSGDRSAALLGELCNEPRFREWVFFLPLPINGGFGWANNQAMLRLLQGADPPDYIHLLNPDTVVERGAVNSLMGFLSAHPQAGAVGSLLSNPDGSTAASAFHFPTVSGEFASGTRLNLINRLLRVPDILMEVGAEAIETDWVPGASVMFRSEALRTVGLFDDGFFLYHEETELMWRMRQAGWTIWCEPASRVTHVAGASTRVGAETEHGKRAIKLPDYWYESRRRMFALLYGRRASFLAALGWAAGHILWHLRRVVGRGGAELLVERDIRDHLRIAVRSSPWDQLSAAPSWKSQPGQAPAWMRYLTDQTGVARLCMKLSWPFGR